MDFAETAKHKPSPSAFVRVARDHFPPPSAERTRAEKHAHAK